MSTSPDAAAAAEPPVLVEVLGEVLVITLNRPAVRNAINLAVCDLVAAALDRLDNEDALRVGVITGSGGSFCSGMDLKAFVAGERPVHPVRGFAGITAKPPRKPIIAAVEGYALAGGCEIVLACDLVVAAEDAQFGIPEVRRGLAAAAGGLFRLPRKLPVNVAMHYALTGELFGAQQAHLHGLVTTLAPAGGASDVAIELAQVIAANAPLALAATKQIMTESADWPLGEEFARQEPIVSPVRASEDAQEGARAFKEKRPPVWRAR